MQANPCFVLPYFTSSARVRDRNKMRGPLSRSYCRKIVYLLHAAATTSGAESANIENTFFFWVHFCGLCMMSPASSATNGVGDQSNACDAVSRNSIFGIEN